MTDTRQDTLLAIDFGTQSVRAMIFDLAGNTIAKSKVIIEPYFSTQPGWAEQHTDYFWENLCKACQGLWAMEGVVKSAIQGVALTTQRATMINVDESGKALRPAISWLDQRHGKHIPPIGGIWGLFFKIARASADAAQFQAEADANWINMNQPEIWRKTHKYLMLSGYLTYQLTGQFVDSIGSPVGYLPFSAHRLNWAHPLDWRWSATPIHLDMLPKLIPPTEVLGEITARAEQVTGIPAGLRLISAAADKACEVVGSGCLDSNIGCLSYGTTATFNTMQSKYLEIAPPIPPYPAAIPNSYNPEAAVNRGYWMVSWFKREFAHYEQQLAAARGVETESLFDELLNAVPPGSMGLILQPYWMPTFKLLGPEAKGAIIGFGDVHTRAHIYRAILEGLAYALREGKERTERRSHVQITELRVSGGGAQSNAAMQLTADIFGLPASRSHTTETSALGAAIDAAVGLKLHPDFRTAINAMTRLERTFTPNAAAQEIYDQLYKRVYKQMYHRLHPLYVEIQKITGYPEPIR